MSAATRVFVYGSLLSGESNHRILGRARRIGVGRTAPSFTLHDLGAYPALCEGGTCAVVGEVYEVDERTLARLDVLEGVPRYYRRIAIALADGSGAESYVLTAAQVEDRPIIASGNWRGHRIERVG